MADIIAKIKSTYLGYESHGILTAYLTVDYGGAGQAIGGYCLSAHADTGRVGTAYGMEFVARILRACGVDSWEKVAGRTIMVRFNGEPILGAGQPIGIGPLPTEPGAWFLWDDIKGLANG